MEKYNPTPQEVKKAEEMMSPEEKEMSEEREATYKAGGKIEKEYLDKQIKDINEEIVKLQMDDDYKGIAIRTTWGKQYIGTHAYVSKDDEGKMEIVLKNDRTNETIELPIVQVDSMEGLLDDKVQITKTKTLWKS
jgi:hypothetical protein